MGCRVCLFEQFVQTKAVNRLSTAWTPVMDLTPYHFRRTLCLESARIFPLPMPVEQEIQSVVGVALGVGMSVTA